MCVFLRVLVVRRKIKFVYWLQCCRNDSYYRGVPQGPFLAPYSFPHALWGEVSLADLKHCIYLAVLPAAWLPEGHSFVCSINKWRDYIINIRLKRVVKKIFFWSVLCYGIFFSIKKRAVKVEKRWRSNERFRFTVRENFYATTLPSGGQWKVRTRTRVTGGSSKER